MITKFFIKIVVSCFLINNELLSLMYESIYYQSSATLR